MNHRQLIFAAACAAALIAPQAKAAGPVLFYDFEDQPLFDSSWDSSFSSDVSGYRLKGSGQGDAMKRPATNPAAWQGGFVFTYGNGATDAISMTLSNTVGLVDEWFVMKSCELDSATAVATLEGWLEGELQWTILADQGVSVSNSPTSGIWPVYTNLTENGEAIDTLPIDTLIYRSNQTSWGNRLNNLYIQPVPAIRTKEKIFDFNSSSLPGFWRPHSIGPFGGATLMSYMNFPTYWWSGTNEVFSRVMHRPGLKDFPAGGGQYEPSWPGGTNDVDVGGFGWRGVFVESQVRSLITNETLQVNFDTVLFTGGDQDARIMDVFFSTHGATNVVNYFGNDFDSWEDELGFALNQSMASDAINIYFDPTDAYGVGSPPVLSVPLSSLGIASITNGAHGNILSVSYTARKTEVANAWLCSIAISNQSTMMSYSVSDVAIENANAYNATQRFYIATANDLSGGDVVSGNGGLGGYEIGNIKVNILMNQPPQPEGYTAFAILYGIDGEPNGGQYEDYDNDGVLNVYEYGWNGDPTNNANQGYLPQMVVSNGVSYYIARELKDPLSGITYEVQATTDLVFTPFAAPAWNSTATNSQDLLLKVVTFGLNTADEMFFRTVISTNSP